MFVELTTLPVVLKLHVIVFFSAFLANSSDKFIWVVLKNVDFLRQMAFLGKMNYQFRKSALDFLLVIHYNNRCISPNYQAIKHFQTFSFWLGFPCWRSFGDFEPLKVDFSTSDTQKSLPYAKPRLAGDS